MNDNKDLLRIEDFPGWLKDKRSGAIISTDNDALTAYRASKRRASKVEELEQRINKMESMLEEILAAVKKG